MFIRFGEKKTVRFLTRWGLVISLILSLMLSAQIVNARAKKIRIWHTEANPRTMELMSQIIKDFEELHPEYELIQEGVHSDKMIPKLFASLSAGTLPTLIQPTTFITRMLYNAGMLRPIDSVVDSIGKENIIECALEPLHLEGHYWGIAHASGTKIDIYRKDWWDKKGLTPAKTWDEWMHNLSKITEDLDGDGRPDIWGFVEVGSLNPINREFCEYVASNGGGVLDREGRPTFTEKEVIETLKMYKELHKYVPPGWKGWAYRDQFVALAKGKVGEIHGFGRGVDYIEQYSPPEIADPDHFAVKMDPRGPSGTTGHSSLDGELWCLTTAADYPEIGIEFLKFFYKRENYKRYVLAFPTQLHPIIPSIKEDPEYRDNPEIKKWWPWIEIQVDKMKRWREILVSPGMCHWYDEEFPYFSQIAMSGVWRDMILDVLEEGMASEEAAAKGQAKAEKIIEEWGYEIK